MIQDIITAAKKIFLHMLPISLFNKKRLWQMCWLLFFYVYPSYMNAQEQTLKYQVIRNEEVIGHLNLHKSIQGSSTHLSAESEVKTRFIFQLVIWAREETIYKNGVLISSSMYRKLNGKEKTNLRVTLEGSTYNISNHGREHRTISYPINFNLLNMYATEPKLILKAYADYFGEWVPIEKTGTNEYKVTLPDGNYNRYFYQNGICTKVEIHHSLYSLQFILVNN